MGIQERKEREKAERRRAILAAARETIRHKTYEEITMEELANQLELSRATLYLYFRNKSEIYATLLTEGIYELREAYDRRLAELKDADPEQQLRALAHAFFEFYQENHSYFDLMITKREELLKDLSEEAYADHKKSGRAIIEPLVHAIEAGRQAGLIGGSYPPEKLAWLLRAIIIGIALGFREGKLKFPDDISLMEEMLFAGLMGMNNRT